MRVHYRTELFARIESCAHYRGSTKSVYYAQYMLSSRGETKKNTCLFAGLEEVLHT